MPVPRMFDNVTENKIVGLYNDGNTLERLAFVFNCSIKPIRNLLIRNNVKRRNRNEYCNGTRKYFFNQQFFDVIDTEAKAYFLGLLYADGCVVNKPRCSRVILATSKDRDILEELANQINYPVNKITYFNKKVIIVNGKTYFGNYDKFTLELNSKYMVNSLIKHGCVPRKSLILKFPTTVPDHLIHHFCRGYFDGDGCISVKRYPASFIRRITILGTKQFLAGIVGWIKNSLKINPSRFYPRHEKVFELQYCRKDDVYAIGRWFYSNANIFLKRKYNKFKLLEVN